MTLAASSFLILCTKYTLCSLSMMLTAFFAVSFTSSNDGFISSALMLLIGICIDLSKYLFWNYRRYHRSFYIFSLVLVVFSCSASVAFFVSEEHKRIGKNAKQSYEYKSHLKLIELLEQEIEAKTKLMATRLDSKYHKQWDKGEQAADELTKLGEALGALVSKSSVVGIDEARRSVSTSAFFLSLSEILDVDFSFLMTICYAILAAILEASSFGVIALAGAKAQPSHFGGDWNRAVIRNSERGYKGFDSSGDLTGKITRGIVSGKVSPILRKVIKEYGVQYPLAKTVFESLVEIGVLRKRGNGYLLTSNALQIATKKGLVSQG